MLALGGIILIYFREKIMADEKTKEQLEKERLEHAQAKHEILRKAMYGEDVVTPALLKAFQSVFEQYTSNIFVNYTDLAQDLFMVGALAQLQRVPTEAVSDMFGSIMKLYVSSANEHVQREAKQALSLMETFYPDVVKSKAKREFEPS